MAKFIKFSVRNSAAAQPLGPTENILVNLEDIIYVVNATARRRIPQT